MKAMNTSKKFLAQMTRNPVGWQISQLQIVAQQRGITWRQKGTSHCVFVNSDGRIMVVPSHRPIQPIYVQRFVKFAKGAYKDADN